MKKKKLLSVTAALVTMLAFQNCGDMNSENLASSSGSDLALVDAKVSRSNSMQPVTSTSGYVEVNSLNSMIQSNKSVDILNYMNSANIKSNVSNQVFFKKEYEDSKTSLISATKFNDPTNVEVFTADRNYVYIRYESTPEVYGGSKNSMRRFEGLKQEGGVFGNTQMGAVWSKRFLNVNNSWIPIKVTYKVDSFNYEKTGSITNGQLGGPEFKMYIWFNFKQSNTVVPFVSSEHQPDHKLILSQQWSGCNTEQYEYAAGIGFVGWRSLVSLHSSCSSFSKGFENTAKTALANYWRNGVTEDYVVVQGMAMSDPLDLSTYNSRVKPSFYPAGVFLDDYPYFFTTKNNLIEALREKTTAPVPIAPPAVTPVPVVPAPVPIKPPVVIRPIVPTATSTVKRLYLEVLGRPADASGLNYYISLMAQGHTEAQIRSYLEDSNEYKIGNFYRYYLNRAPDSSGLNYYLGLVEQGEITLSDVERYLRESDECKTKCL